jgi:hemerythrin-like domain-containing protein
MLYPQDKKEINILLYETGDIRHIIKTIADNCEKYENGNTKINVANFSDSIGFSPLF